MEVTVDIPDELMPRLQAFQDQLPDILELGLRKWQANHCAEIEGLADVLEALANLPTPQEVLSLRPSTALQERINALLEKNRSRALTPAEQKEWAYYQFVEHLVRVAKAKAAIKLKAS